MSYAQHPLQQQPPPFKRNGPAADEIEIIGVEFTIRKPNGIIEELAMFATPGMIIPRAMTPGGGYQEYEPRITFHTNIGDFTITSRTGNNCPW